MRSQMYKNYFEEETLTATPLELVELMYRGAIDAIVDARRHVRQQDIRARSRAITKAMALVTELSRTLNHAQGGELSCRLEQVYGYVLRLLMQANAEQIEAPLAEAEKLIATLQEAWAACRANQQDAEVFEQAECA